MVIGNNTLIDSSVDIIIVNWNSGNQLHECLSSIGKSNLDAVSLSKVIVVDNASSDNSLGGIERLPLPLTVLRNSENRGFAAACNQGACAGTSEYLLFLNPDTIVDGDVLEVPVVFMERMENQRVGVVGIQLVDENGMVSHTCTRFPTPLMFFSAMIGLDKILPGLFESHFMSSWNHGESRQVDHVIGAFYFVRRSLFESLRGFDERYFVYLEDLDFSYRAHKAGGGCYFLTDVKAFHKGGGTSEQVKAIRLFYSLRSRILYGYKHFSRVTATLLLVGTMVLEPLSRLAMCLVRRSASQLVETIEGYAMLWKSLPGVLKTSFKEK